MAAEVADEYLSSLTDLTVNSKPLINMLTMLAEENSSYAPSIVQAIESHINKVSPDVKLPILYLIDSIVKNVSAVYVPLFTNNIVQIFASVFEKVDEKTRMSMFKLRQTWNDIFPAKKMYTLDLRIQHIDQNWPILSPPPTSIHLNPKFLNQNVNSNDTTKAVKPPSSASILSSEHEATIIKKQQILQELQQKKRELELFQQKVLFGDQLPQAIVRPVVHEDAAKSSRTVSIPKSTPKAVIIPPNSTPAAANNQPPVPKTKIAPVNSMLIAAAKSRDPRLAKMQATKKNNDEPKQKKSSKVNQVDDPLEDILRKQKSAIMKTSFKKVEKEVPEVKITEEQIHQRQMAMLKAPVLGQLNRKGSDVTEKPRRRQYSPQRKGVKDRRDNSKSSSDKDSPSKNRSYRDSKVKRKHRDKSSRSDSKSEENKVGRKIGKSDPKEVIEIDDSRVPEIIEPVFSPDNSPPASENGVSSPKSSSNQERPITILSPEPPPPPSIGSQDNVIEIMDVEEEETILPDRDETVGFKNVKAVKSRNYKRRNKERSLTPPPPMDSAPLDESNVRQVLKSTSEESVDVGKDVDLRLLTIGNSKKRSSTDGNMDSPPSKRGKDGDTIQLFGNKDMDERLPPGGLRTPPPPVISTTPPLGSPNGQDSRSDSIGRSTTALDHSEHDGEVINNDGLDRLHLLNTIGNDVDKTKILDEFIVTAKDQLNRGTITPAQYKQYMHQIVQTTENEKIKSAQKRRDSMIKSNEDGSYERSPRSNFSGQGFRSQGPWRNDEEGPPFGRRWRGRGGYGPRGRAGGEPHWHDRDNRFQHGGNSPEWMDSDSRSQEAWVNMTDVSIPPTDPSLLTAISSDPVRHISIDGTPRAIRFYGNFAVVMLSFSNAREISFENGMRRVFIAGLEIPCQFNGPPMPFIFQKNTHTVRLGAPTRELYIDDDYCEVQFGGPPVQAQLAGVPCTVQLDGPPPQVRIAPHGNPLCLGSVLLIVDARCSFPIYLDAKPQRFEINGRPLVFKFAKKLTLVLINDVPVPLQFGGSPFPIHFFDGQHFLRLTELPPGVTPGRVNITGMDDNECSPVHLVDGNSMEGQNQAESGNPALPPISELSRGVYTDLVSSMMDVSSEVEKIVGFNYTIEPDQEVFNAQTATIPPLQGDVPVAPPILQNLNINDLFQSLVATGIISKQAEVTPVNIKDDKPKLETNFPPLKPISFDDTNSLKTKQAGAHSALYSGIQCGSCGIRFHPDDTQKYSQHLDWHFRQNRRGRDALRHGSCRRWYYDVKDWKEFNEIEELEDRAQSWFETEAQSLGVDNVEEEVPPSEPAPRGGGSVMCSVCRDRFDTFFHEDTEEWHLKNCIAIDGKYYHPTCHQDAMEVTELEAQPIMAPPLLEPLQVEEPKMEESVVILEVDDDDHDDGMDDIEVVTADEEDIRNVVNQLVERVVMEEECEASPIEDDDLEVLAVTNTNETREPIAYIEIEDNTDDDDEYIDEAGNPILLFDPNKTIKLEPVDDMESPVAQVDQTLSNVVSTIDGNVALCEAPVAPTAAPSKIKITFTKPAAPTPAPVPISDIVVEPIDPNELQIEEIVVEPLPIKPKKPRIAERVIKEYPPCMKGTEMSGLCSIM